MKGIHRINPCICVSWEQIPEEAERCSIWTTQRACSAEPGRLHQLPGCLQAARLKETSPDIWHWNIQPFFLYLLGFPSWFSPSCWSITTQVTPCTNEWPELMSLVLTKGERKNCKLGHSRAEYSCASLGLFQKCVEMEDRHLRKQKFRINFSLHEF